MPGGDRHAQADCAGVEEGDLRGRPGVDRPGGHRMSWDPGHFDPTPPASIETPPPRPHWLRRLLAPFAGVALFIWKLFGPLLLLLKNFKFLATSATFLVSLAAYTSIWGWQFALGLMMLLFVPE